MCIKKYRASDGYSILFYTYPVPLGHFPGRLEIFGSLKYNRFNKYYILPVGDRLSCPKSHYY